MKFFFLIVLLSGFINLGHAQEDEAIIDELHEQRAEHQAQIKPIEETVEKIEEAPQKIKDGAIELGEKALTIDDLMSEKFQKMIEETLKNNPLKDMDREELKRMLLERSQGQPVEKLFKSFPVTLDIAVDMVRDEKAALGLIRLAKKKDALMNYTAIWIVLFLSFWMLRKRIAPKTAPFIRRFIFKTILSITGSVISFSIFYYMFKDEIAPTIAILVKNLL